MVLGIKTRKIEKAQGTIGVREVFNLWDILKSKYQVLERIQNYEVFVHDLDLKILLRDFISELAENSKVLEATLKQYGITGPDRGQLPSKWAGNSEVLRDEFICSELVIYVQEHIENMLHVTRTSATNDDVRLMMINMLKKTINRVDLLYKYVKIKGWIEPSPAYPNVPPEETEKISCSTAGCMWDLLSFRYDNIQETMIFRNFLNDGDFKLVIDKGLTSLKAQAKILEKECERFGITIPKKPIEVVATPENTEILRDDRVYRAIISGLQGAAMIHAASFKKCIENDRIRKIFKQMLLDEVAFYEGFLKYGKLKGWLNPAPMYRS